ncbi:MAG: NmrA family NAD(P)-binding protein [Thermoanaerobaculia bacterium]
MYAVAGVSGHTGSVVAEELLRRGEKVRVLVRDEAKGEPWKAKGAEVAIAPIDDERALTKALTGVDGAYLLNPTPLQATDMITKSKEIGDVWARAIKASGVKHVVFLSSIGAQHESGTGPIRGLHQIEQRLLPLGINLTLLRPTYFLENWGTSLGPAQADGVLPSFLPADLRFPQIATKDIGMAAADALLNPPDGVRILELAGPEDYTPTDIANAVGNILGKPVNVGVGPLEAVVPALTSFGISEHIAGLFREMYEGLISGHVAWDGKGERKRGVTTPNDVLAPMLRA